MDDNQNCLDKDFWDNAVKYLEDMSDEEWKKVVDAYDKRHAFTSSYQHDLTKIEIVEFEEKNNE